MSGNVIILLMQSNKQLVDFLIEDGVLKTALLIEAFLAIDRIQFVPEGLEAEAYQNYPLPIGSGQTISQPWTVAFMLELLQPQPGEKILDVGAGSGWTSTLLAYVVNHPKSQNSKFKQRESRTRTGRVCAIELLPEISKIGRANVAKFNFIEKGIVEWICGDGSKGLPDQAPFDRILASAASDAASTFDSAAAAFGSIPGAWKEQVKVGGVIVAPVGDSVIRLTKTSEKSCAIDRFPGFTFVPLRAADSPSVSHNH